MRPGRRGAGEVVAARDLRMLLVGGPDDDAVVAAAAGTKTAMILGPSDPRRYAPFTPDSLALWKPTTLAAGAPAEWDWARDGIGPDEAWERLLA